MPFHDRAEAGRRLAKALERWRPDDPIVLGLPRGGVPVAFEVARALGAPLDVILVRKLGVPYQPELAMGAIGEGGIRLIDGEIVAQAGVEAEELATVEARERIELARRAERFRPRRDRLDLTGRTAIVVDDGIATGATAGVACRVARAQGARSVVLAVPVAPREAVARLRNDADKVACLETPSPFYAIGEWYADFRQTPDETVVALLDEARSWR